MRFRCVTILAVLFFIFSFASVAYPAEPKFRPVDYDPFANLSEMDDASAAYQKGDFATAIKKFRKSAEQGNGIAQSYLGVMYYDGKGVPQDHVLAYMWFNIAAYNGNSSAAVTRAVIVEKMTPGQIEKAQTLTREWLEKKGK